MARYSVSQIQVYVQCPLKYRYRYIDKIHTPEFVETTDVPTEPIKPIESPNPSNITELPGTTPETTGQTQVNKVPQNLYLYSLSNIKMRFLTMIKMNL